jgi:hypothetical protein
MQELESINLTEWYYNITHYGQLPPTQYELNWIFFGSIIETFRTILTFYLLLSVFTLLFDTFYDKFNEQNLYIFALVLKIMWVLSAVLSLFMLFFIG